MQGAPTGDSNDVFGIDPAGEPIRISRRGVHSSARPSTARCAGVPSSINPWVRSPPARPAPLSARQVARLVSRTTRPTITDQHSARRRLHSPLTPDRDKRIALFIQNSQFVISSCQSSSIHSLSVYTYLARTLMVWATIGHVIGSLRKDCEIHRHSELHQHHGRCFAYRSLGPQGQMTECTRPNRESEISRDKSKEWCRISAWRSRCWSVVHQ